MKQCEKVIILFTSLFVSGFLLLQAPAVYAATPVLSLSTAGQSGDYVQVTVTGDPNATAVNLFVASQGIIPLSSLNSNGTLTAIIGSAESENQVVSISPNTAVYVKTGGINGQMSNQVSWPYVQSSTTTAGALILSPTALLLNAGQTSTITANANNLYLLSNSQPTVANINFNANQITVQAITYGSTVANVCIVGNASNCANIAITVQNSGAQQLNFSQNNFSIVSGQSVPVTITGGSGTYIISNNSNTNAVQTSLNGQVVTLTAGSATGSASITVCTTDMNNCGVINASSTTVNSTAITFSQTNPVVPLGQSATVTIYGGTGSNFYVSSNSNPSIVQANITGNILTLVANANSGTSAISVCAFAGTCGSLTANISNVSSGGAISLSQNSISILAGQSSNITISGGSPPYNISSGSPDIFNGVINGNVLTIYGVNPGSATANICASAGCVSLSITINSVNASVNPPAFSQNNILLNAGQQTTVNISGNGNYYVVANSNPAAVSLQISGGSATVIASNAGSSNISICQNGGQCATLYVTVSAATPTPAPIIPSAPSAPITPTIPAYVFPRYLGYGDKGGDVLMLQQVLVRQGFLSATPTGRYGPATVAAIKKFQQAHSIRQTGNFGPATKDTLNQILASTGSTAAPSANAQQISSIQQEIQQLLAQVAQMHGQ